MDCDSNLQLSDMSESYPASRPFFPATAASNQRASGVSFFFLCLFTVSVYARPEDLLPSLGALHLTLVFGLCAGAAYLASLMSGRTRLLWSRELGIVFLLTIWYIVGLPFSVWKSGSLNILFSLWLKTLFAFFLLTQTVFSLDRIRILVWTIIISELAVTGASIVLPSRALWVGERLIGVNHGILGWNFLGIAAALTIPYLAALFLVHRSILARVLLGAAFISLIWALVLTASRSGLLTVVVSTLATLLLVLRTSSRGKAVGIGIAAVLLVAINLAPQVLWERLGTVWNSSSVATNAVAASAAESQDDRLAVLTRSIQYTLENPIFGLGLGNFEITYGSELGDSGAWIGTHNTFTQISSEAGIPALLLFLAVLIGTLCHLTTFRLPRFGDDSEADELQLMRRATFAGLLSFTFGAFFAHLAYEYYFFYPLAIAVGLKHVALARYAVPEPLAGELSLYQTAVPF